MAIFKYVSDFYVCFEYLCKNELTHFLISECCELKFPIEDLLALAAHHRTGRAIMDLTHYKPLTLLVKSRSDLVTWPQDLDSFLFRARTKVQISGLQSSVISSAAQTEFSFRKITQRQQRSHDIEVSFLTMLAAR